MVPRPPSTSRGPGIANSSVNVGGAYTAVVPFRLVDTRAGSGYYGQGQPLGPGATFTFPVAGKDGVPSAATAAALNVTVTDTTSPSYLTVFPAGGSQPFVSSVNWGPGETVPNLVIVPLGNTGEVSVFNQLGQADLVVDLEGYFVPEAGGSSQGSYGALTPARLLDTRTNSRTLHANSSLNLQVTATGGVPQVSEVGAVLLNLTVTNTSLPSYLTVYPEGATKPTASNLNWMGGQTVPNRVVVPVNSSNGQITIYNANGQADVVVDVDGYFSKGSTPPANASLYTAVNPVRAIDTRSGSGEPGAGDTLGPGGVDYDTLSWIGSLGSNVTAVVSNVTTTDTSSPSYLTVYPGPSQPPSSDLNWLGGETVANLTVATVGSDGIVYFYNDLGDTDLVVDIFGYFSSAPTLTSGVSTSTNWSGYVEQSGPQTAVTGTFTVPSLYQGQTGTYMTEWVGIDGWTDSTVIQAGVDEYPDSANNTMFYYDVWYELYPSAPVLVDTQFPNMVPGDPLTVTIYESGSNTWTISLDDPTQGESYTTVQTYSGNLSSADWIVEAPTNPDTSTTYPLAQYTTTEFTGISASGPDTSDTALVMEQNSTYVSFPSAPGEGGSSFYVSYGSAANPP